MLQIANGLSQVLRQRVALTDGKTVPFDDVVDRAVAFWSQFFSQNGLE